jgi:hypothetical protein
MTYSAIATRVRHLGGGYAKPCWIAHVKADNGLTRGQAPNRIDPISRVAPCPPAKRRFIERALRDLGLISP